jgi:ribosomal-protein-alanine N-acetyltransferase
MLQPPDRIEGQKVRIRRSTPADAGAVYLAAADPEVMRYLDWPAHKGEIDARDFLDGCAARWEAGSEYHYMIEEVSSNASVGCIGYRVAQHAADFGYFVARAHWGKGLATQAAALLLTWLKAQPEILRVWATVDVENVRSIAVLVRSGLQREGVLRMAKYRPNIGGPPRDTAVFSLCKGDV